MIVLFLTGVVAMIMLRTLHKDISSYNEMQTLEEAQEESGWKLVHGDVFRPPSFSPMLLSVLTGSDLCVLTMSLYTMIHSVTQDLQNEMSLLILNFKVLTVSSS